MVLEVAEIKACVTGILYYIFIYFLTYLLTDCGPGSSVGIATDIRLDGLGIESRWGQDFLIIQTGPGTHPASCTMGARSFPRVKCGRGVLLITHPLLVPLVLEE